MANSFAVRLSEESLLDVAFDIASAAQDGIYKNELAAALAHFTTVPSTETALQLVALLPRFAEVLDGYSKSVCRQVPVAMRGPKCRDLDAFVADRRHNLRMTESIHQFLHVGWRTGHIKVGFHSLRDQSELLRRLEVAGVKKPRLSEPRPFLRDAITGETTGFFSVSDLVCIHGFRGAQEVHYDALGRLLQSDWYLKAEVLYDIGSHAAGFEDLLTRLGA